MNSVVQFCLEHWTLVVALFVALTNIANAVTNHWSNYAGLKKVALFLTEITSFLASKDSSKVLKVPGTTE